MKKLLLLALLLFGAADAQRLFVTDSGGVEREVKRLFVTDSGGVEREIKRLFVTDSGGVERLVFVLITETVTLIGDTISFSVGTPGSTATWAFLTDGTIERQSIQYEAGIQWIDSQPTPENEYWLIVTAYTGAAPSSGPTEDTCVKLAGSGAAARSIVWVSNGSSNVVGSATVGIASDAACTDILDTGVFGANITDI